MGLTLLAGRGVVSCCSMLVLVRLLLLASFLEACTCQPTTDEERDGTGFRSSGTGRRSERKIRGNVNAGRREVSQICACRRVFMDGVVGFVGDEHIACPVDDQAIRCKAERGKGSQVGACRGELVDSVVTPEFAARMSPLLSIARPVGDANPVVAKRPRLVPVGEISDIVLSAMLAA